MFTDNSYILFVCVRGGVGLGVKICHLIFVVISGRLDRLLEVFVLFGSVSRVLEEISTFTQGVTDV